MTKWPRNPQSWDLDAEPVAEPDDRLVLKDGVIRRGSAAGGGGGAAYDETVGDGTEVTFDVTHDLGTSAIVVDAWEVSSGERLAPAWLILDNDTVRVVFTSAPDTDDARVVVLASGGSGGTNGEASVVSRTARFGRLFTPMAGNTPSSNNGFNMRFTTLDEVTIEKITFFVSSAPAENRIRLHLLEDDYSRQIKEVLHEGDWRDGVSSSPFEEETDVTVPAGAHLAATIEGSGSFTIWAQSDGQTARAAASHGSLFATMSDNYGGNANPGDSVGDSVSQYGSTAMNCWIDYTQG